MWNYSERRGNHLRAICWKCGKIYITGGYPEWDRDWENCLIKVCNGELWTVKNSAEAAEVRAMLPLDGDLRRSVLKSRIAQRRLID